MIRACYPHLSAEDINHFRLSHLETDIRSRYDSFLSDQRLRSMFDARSSSIIPSPPRVKLDEDLSAAYDESSKIRISKSNYPFNVTFDVNTFTLNFDRKNVILSLELKVRNAKNKIDKDAALKEYRQAIYAHTLLIRNKKYFDLTNDIRK